MYLFRKKHLFVFQFNLTQFVSNNMKIKIEIIVVNSPFINFNTDYCSFNIRGFIHPQHRSVDVFIPRIISFTDPYILSTAIIIQLIFPFMYTIILEGKKWKASQSHKGVNHKLSQDNKINIILMVNRLS